MKVADIQTWLECWERSVVQMQEIHSVDDMRLARKFVPEMRNGHFAAVSDENMWDALVDLRGHRAHEAECREAALAAIKERSMTSALTRKG